MDLSRSGPFVAFPINKINYSGMSGEERNDFQNRIRGTELNFKPANAIYPPGYNHPAGTSAVTNSNLSSSLNANSIGQNAVIGGTMNGLVYLALANPVTASGTGTAWAVGAASSALGTIIYDLINGVNSSNQQNGNDDRSYNFDGWGSSTPVSDADSWF